MIYSGNLDSGPDLTFHDLNPGYQEFEPCTWHKLVK